MDTTASFSYKDYQQKKRGDYQSVGMFGDKVYAYEQLTGYSNMPEYRQITKQEFETFEQWSKEDVKDLGLLAEIRSRDVLCSAHKGESKIVEIQTEVMCPVCKRVFLCPEEDVPDEEDLYIFCPNCNKPLDQKLVEEIKCQLHNAGIEIEGIGEMLRQSYINPSHINEGKGYVETLRDKYELKIQKQGKSSVDHTVSDTKEAAYWILSQIVHSVEEEKLKSEQNEKKHEKKLKKALIIDFEKMDQCYDEWFLEK